MMTEQKINVPVQGCFNVLRKQWTIFTNVKEPLGCFQTVNPAKRDLPQQNWPKVFIQFYAPLYSRTFYYSLRFLCVGHFSTCQRPTLLAVIFASGQLAPSRKHLDPEWTRGAGSIPASLSIQLEYWNASDHWVPSNTRVFLPYLPCIYILILCSCFDGIGCSTI
jgi:hypothetical protein